MTRFRPHVPVVVLLFALGTVPTDGNTSATPTLRYSYAGFLQEAPVLTLQIDVTSTGSAAYRLSLGSDLIGLMSRLFPFHLQAISEGRFDGHRSVPSRYRSEIALQNGYQAVTLIYGRGGKIQMIDQPPTEEGQEAFRKGLVTGTIDPLSAVAWVAHDVGAGRACVGRLQVFDGARRYDVSLSPVPHSMRAPANLPAELTSAPIGCDAVLVLLSGFPQEAVDSGAYPRTIRFWFASISNSRWGVLLRADAESSYGHVRLQFVGAQALP